MITPNSARSAIMQAYSIDLHGGDDFTGVVGSGRASSIQKISNQYEAGIVIAAVEAQGDLRNWLLWAYGPYLWADRDQCIRVAFRLVAGVAELDFEAMKENKRVRTELMVLACMDNYRTAAVNGGTNKYRKPAHFAAAVDRLSGGQYKINLSNYNRDFAYLEELIHDACNKLDARGLGPVREAVDRVRALQGAA